MTKVTTIELSFIEYEFTDDCARVNFYTEPSPGHQEIAAELKVYFVSLSFYAKQHLQKQPSLLECGVVISGNEVDKFLIPTGRTRVAGNGSIAVKYYDVTKPITDDEVEKFERVGIRLPTGVFTYAFFESQYLARAEDPRRGALFLIDPGMIIVQYPMTNDQKMDFQTFGGKKVLYFDVLDAPNLQERMAEMKRCQIRGDERRKKYEEADRQWEEEMEARLENKAKANADKPKLSKKAKQKAKQAEKNNFNNTQTPRSSLCNSIVAGSGGEALLPIDDMEAETKRKERLHKLKQAESRARAEEDSRLEREAEITRRKLEAVEAKRKASEEAAEARRHADAESAKMERVKNLLQKVQSSLKPERQGALAAAGVGKNLADEESSGESSDDEGTGGHDGSPCSGERSGGCPQIVEEVAADTLDLRLAKPWK